MYSWFDEGEEPYFEIETVDQIKLGIEIAISNKGRLYFQLKKKAYDRFTFTYFLSLLC